MKNSEWALAKDIFMMRPAGDYFSLKKVDYSIRVEWIRGVDEWREGKIGEELSSRLLRQLQGNPVPALCEYLRAFEKSAKKIRDAKEKQ